jgi:hypothetical protein
MPSIKKYILVLIFFQLNSHWSAFAQSSLYVAKELSFNKPLSSEIAPVLLKDGIMFCSDRKTSSLKETKTFKDERLYHVYYVQRIDTSRWGKPTEIKGINNPVLYYGPLSVASDGKTVYFTSSILSGKAAKRRKIQNPRGIFVGQLVGTSIVQVKPFEYNNPQYSVAQPSISPDGKFLFFVSDMPVGQGGSDLYYCELINNKWSPPVNLGNKVNSVYKENYPYMHSSGRLYFSSDRPGGLGGMDVYYTFMSQGKWQEPVHLPPEINSPADDFAFVAEDNLQSGYIASNRNNGNDNIFRFSSTTIRKVKCDSLQYNNYCYEFVDENAVKFDSIPFLYRWSFGDGTVSEGVKVDHCFKGPGNYVVSLDVVNLITKKIQKNEKTINLEITDIEQPYISAPDICSTGRQISLSADSTNLPGWNIKLYYWNFGDDSVATGKEVNKTFSKPGIYNIQLIVTAEPDGTHGVRETCVSKNIEVIR